MAQTTDCGPIMPIDWSTPSREHREASTFEATRTNPSECSDEYASIENLPSFLRAVLAPSGRARQEQRHKPVIEMNTTRTDQLSLRAKLSKKKSQFFEDAFSSRSQSRSGKGSVAEDSMIMVDVKLTQEVSIGCGFMADFAFFISSTYQRPANCVALTVTKVTMLIDSSCDAAYQVSITALDYDVAATKNKRASGLIQAHMYETFNIPARRGVVVFHSLPHENMMTASIHMNDKLEQASCHENDQDKQTGSGVESSGTRSGLSTAKSCAKPTNTVSETKSRSKTLVEQKGISRGMSWGDTTWSDSGCSENCVFLPTHEKAQNRKVKAKAMWASRVRFW